MGVGWCGYAFKRHFFTWKMMIWLVVSNIFYFPFHIWDVILPIDEVIFFKMVIAPPTSDQLMDSWGTSTIHHHFFRWSQPANRRPRYTWSPAVRAVVYGVPRSKSSLMLMFVGMVIMDDNGTLRGPQDISWFISPSIYSSKYHKP